ncbi:MAG: homoserine kinase [Trueperaceae bacterium]
MLRARVPATSANLGPGFDTLGMALDLHLDVHLTPAARDAFVYRGSGSVGDDPDNLVHRGFRAVHQAVGRAAPPVRFEVDNPIPLARGLGSSSAALVAGAALADAMLGEPLGKDGVFRVAARLEGHPDNVAPAVFGGFTVSAADDDGEYRTVSLAVPAAWRLVFGVPPFELGTAAARAALPERYDRADVILTSSRTALWVAAVATGDSDLLRTAALDVLHQPFRAPLVPGLLEITHRLRAAGAAAAFLSGAGPTIGVVTVADHLEACSAALRSFVGDDGAVLALEAATGYRTERC